MAKILSSVVVAVTVALLAVCAGLVAADVDENQRPPDDAPYYRAAVFEFPPVFRNPALPVTTAQADAVVETNLAVYAEAVANASAAGAQIIVFPEDGLYGFLNCKRSQIFPYLEFIPDPASAPNPCLNASLYASRPILRTMSCLARDHAMVVVLDMGDVQPCEVGVGGCPQDGHFQFNTQVAFDQEGTLIGRYFKNHLFYEPQYNHPAVPDVVYFDTSFGVRFGMMICFDIMFSTPSLDLIEKYGITDIAYSSWWVNTPPSFTAVSWYQAWTRHFEVNLIAAGGVMSPAWVFSGSGMFSSGTVLSSYFNTGVQPRHQLLVTNVPKLSLTARRASSSATHTRWPLEPLSLPTRPQQLQLDHHCAVTSDSKRRNDGHADAIAMRAHGERGGAGSGSLGWSFTPFEAYPGAAGTVKAVLGDLVCTARYAVAHEVQIGEPPVYAVLAHAGSFQGFYNEQFCGLYACTNMTYCAADTLDLKAAEFVDFDLYGLFSTSTTRFGLVSSAGGALVPRDQIYFADVESTRSLPSTTVETVLKNSRPSGFNTTLLGASIVALYQSA